MTVVFDTDQIETAKDVKDMIEAVVSHARSKGIDEGFMAADLDRIADDLCEEQQRTGDE